MSTAEGRGSPQIDTTADPLADPYPGACGALGAAGARVAPLTSRPSRRLGGVAFVEDGRSPRGSRVLGTGLDPARPGEKSLMLS